MQLSVSEIDHSGMFTGVVRDITEERELEDEIVRIATFEQRRIGQELHDDILQNLTGLGLLTQNLSEMLAERGDAEVHALAAKVAASIADTHKATRALAKGLIPAPVTAEELVSALAELAKRTTIEFGVACRFEPSEEIPIADDNTALHLYRMAQEAVGNAIRYAQSETINIVLENQHREIILSIADNGIGIDIGKNGDSNQGLGLRIMAHRCGLLGGVFSVAPRPEGGTLVLCRIPKAPTEVGRP
jgi:signal transduction histidine kinase